MSGYRWSQPEINYLSDLAGEFPIAYVHKDYNRWAAANGHPERSIHAIKRAIVRFFNVSTVPEGEWLGTDSIGRAINRTEDAIARWVKLRRVHRDQVRRTGYGFFISRRGLRDLARRHPDYFNHCTHSQLFALLEDLDTVEYVLAAPPSVHRPRPIICPDTGSSYPSMGAAAKAIGCYPNTIRMALLRGGTAKGLRFQFQEAA